MVSDVNFSGAFPRKIPLVDKTKPVHKEGQKKGSDDPAREEHEFSQEQKNKLVLKIYGKSGKEEPLEQYHSIESVRYIV